MIKNTNDAIRTINAIAALPDDDAMLYIAIRDRLMNDDASLAYIPDALRTMIDDAIRALESDSIYAIAALSDLRLNYSLCPMHAHDYAICFDDDDPDCAAIRAHFPIHDT